jgi:hypothetical protein
MADARVATRHEGEALLIEKARTDEGFRRELIANPSSTINKIFGVQLPADLTVTVVEESASQVYLVLPARSAGMELAEEELAAVAGGAQATDAGFFKKIVGDKATRAREAAEVSHNAEQL